MNELQETQQDKVVNIRQAQHEKQRFFGKTKMHKGQTMYEYNVLEGTIAEAEFEESVYQLPQAPADEGFYPSPGASGYNDEATQKAIQETIRVNGYLERFNDMVRNPIRRKLIVKENCFYVPAINEKTALKKLLKRYKK